MTGVLFHGPEVFDSGWAGRIIRAFSGRSRPRLMLAGAMSRTALLDSGIKGVETPGLQPSQCVKLLEKDCSAALLATFSKSAHSGLVFGSLVAGRAAFSVPLVQAECSGPVYSEQSGACPAAVITKLEKLGFCRSEAPQAGVELWTRKGLSYRRMTTAEKGDFVFLNGIVVGRALGSGVVFVSKDRSITGIRGVRIKPHSLEKLERLGGVDLASAKLASTRRLRSIGARARVQNIAGRGVAFIDHAGMESHKLAGGAEGAVTVGDDTTAVAGDILYRFGIPVIGIVDGDGDGVIVETKLYPGSTVFTVKADDLAGLEVFRKIFAGKNRTRLSFAEVKAGVQRIVAAKRISRMDY